MPIPSYILSNAAQVLAELFRDQESIRRVAETGGVGLANVNIDVSPADGWHAVVREAERQGRLRYLLEAAQRDYPPDAPLGKTLALLRDALLDWGANDAKKNKAP